MLTQIGKLSPLPNFFFCHKKYAEPDFQRYNSNIGTTILQILSGYVTVLGENIGIE